jgi:hypothetical protein
LPRRRATSPPGPQRHHPPAFDALALKQRAQEELLEATAGMTREEERSFYRQRARTGSLGAWWAQVEAHGRSGLIHGQRDGAGPAPEDPSSTPGTGGSPDATISGHTDMAERHNEHPS